MLGETDDWSHDHRYDRVLQTLALTDAWFKELWTWLQSQDDYRDKTTILITTDHGRGNTPADWHTHGEKVEGAQYTWLAAIGPDFAPRGEWRDAPTAHTNQVAATMATVLGVGADFAKANPNAGKPIDLLLKRLGTSQRALTSEQFMRGAGPLTTESKPPLLLDRRRGGWGEWRSSSWPSPYLKRPALTVFAPQELVGRRQIRDAHVGRVVLNLAARPQRHDAEQHHLGQP